jgi:hypothetical protein
MLCSFGVVGLGRVLALPTTLDAAVPLRFSIPDRFGRRAH